MKNFKGFTLIELMITLELVGILVGFALPSFQELIKNNRMTASTNALQGSLRYAQSTASNTGQNVVICTKTTASDGCNSSQNCQDGWIVFMDRDNPSDGLDSDNDCTDATKDCILRVQEPLAINQTLVYSGTNAKSLIFDIRGIVANTGQFVLCDDRGSNDAMAIAVNPVSQKRLSDSDGIVNDENGNNITCP